MKILYVGDALVHSGFARLTHNICDTLHSIGHDVNVLGLHSFGEPNDYPYPIYPCRSPFKGGGDYAGVGRLGSLTLELAPDIIVIQCDPWMIPAYLKSLEDVKSISGSVPPVVGFLAIDGENQNGKELHGEDGGVGLSHVVCWTQFGVNELIKGGWCGPTSVVPLGVDCDVFRPLCDSYRQICKRLILPETISEDSFVVGFVGRNQTRKRLDLTIEYFSEWVHKCNVDDAVLFLHCAPTGDHGVKLSSLTKYHDVVGKVQASDLSVGWGVEEHKMVSIYNAFNVFFTTTQGEGWGYPVHESMACGIPCIVPDWSGLGDWTKGAVYAVECSSTNLTAPINSSLYTVGGVMDKGEAVEALDMIYRSTKSCRIDVTRGLKRARQLTAKNTGQMFLKMLESIRV